MNITRRLQRIQSAERARLMPSLIVLIAALLFAYTGLCQPSRVDAASTDASAGRLGYRLRPGETLIGLRATMERRAIQRRGSVDETELPSFLASHEVSRGRTDLATVALTFDCGLGNETTRSILDTLRESNVRATFFLEGRFIQAYPDLVATMARDGHELGNHSMHHPDFTGLDPDAIAPGLTDVTALLDALGERAGLPSATSRLHLFRFPYGKRSPETLRAIAMEWYQSISWSVDPRGWLDAATAAMVSDHVLAHAHAGDIILQHCDSQADADALPEIIDGLRDRGLAFASVSQIMRTDDLRPERKDGGSG